MGSTRVQMRLRYLRVKNDVSTSRKTTKACATELSDLINCWRINGLEGVHCEALAMSLALCAAQSVLPFARLILRVLEGGHGVWAQGHHHKLNHPPVHAAHCP